MDVFKRHDGYAEYYNDLYGDVLASCEDEELEEYELSENEVAKKDLNEEEEKEEELNKEETNDVINEKEELDVEAEDANKGKGALPKLAEGEWTLVVKQPGRALKAIKKKTVKKTVKQKKDKNKKKKKHKNKKCVRVQSHNGRVSEVSCENFTHTAIVAQKFVYVQETLVGLVFNMNLGGIAMGLIWDCHVIAMGFNLGGIATRGKSGGITK